MDPIVQTNFSGGMNLYSDDFRLSDGEYGEAFNIRTRGGSVSPIKEPLEDDQQFLLYDMSGNPHIYTIPGKKQGIYGFATYALLFADGKAYYKSIASIYWTYIANIHLDATVDYIYVQAVPVSPTTYGRELYDSDYVYGEYFFLGMKNRASIVVNGVPSGIVIQDGVTQPYFIWISGGVLNVKQLNTYSQWSLADREYVPIGKQMTVVDAILFVASPDGKEFYRSVSGRFLDFVVNVTELGDKGGDATTTSYSVSANEVTALIGVKSGLLLVGTVDGCYPLELNYEKAIFGEPTFNNTHSFKAGIVSQFSLVELINDYAFIDLDGFRSYNAVSQLNNEGRDSIFSLKVNKLVDGLTQISGNCSAIIFNNYAFFSCKTIYGYCFIVYDRLAEAWVCIDQYYLIEPIKMMALINEATSPVLFAITNSKVYRLFSGADFLESRISIRRAISGIGNVELKLDNFRPIFDQVKEDIDITVSEVVNNRIRNTIPRTITLVQSGMPYPIPYPVVFNTNDSVDDERFNFSQISVTGYKVGVDLSWQGEAKLIHCQYDVMPITFPTPMKQQARIS